MKRLFVLLCACLGATLSMASVVDWQVQFTQGSEMNQKWQNAQIYSYLTLIPSMTDVAISPSDIMAEWTTDYAGSDTVKVGTSRPYAEGNTGGVSWDRVGTGPLDGPFPGFLIIVLVNPDGEIMYAYQGTDTFSADMLPYRDETSGNLSLIEFDENSNWTILGGDPIDPDVPEPTALALLALGVAGVALRRRIH